MPEPQRVLIVHADGREYTVLPSDFTNPIVSTDKNSYADQGFRVVSYADGTSYGGPKTKREIEQAAEDRATVRAERVAAQSDSKPSEDKAGARGST